MERVYIAQRENTYFLIHWGDENANQSNGRTGMEDLASVARGARTMCELNYYDEQRRKNHETALYRALDQANTLKSFAPLYAQLDNADWCLVIDRLGRHPGMRQS